jgi:glycosyltransferase involved in cell wall biosynthesis
MKISGVLTIKDGIYLGYPFLEAILSVLPIVDEFLINDGGSEDGTIWALKKLKKVFPKIKIFQVPWFKSDCWETIDRTLEYLIEKAKGDWIFEVQGDEIWHENDIMKLKEVIEYANLHHFNSIRQPRLDCSFTSIDDYIYRNVRIVRKIPNLKSYWGGDDFQIGNPGPPREGFTAHNVPPELETSIPYYHFHRVFPKNALRADERIAKEIAPKNVERLEAFKILKEVNLNSFTLPRKNEVLSFLPALMKGLSQELEYKVREELFDKKWLSKITGLNYEKC